MNADIIDYIKKTQNILIGETTAEQVKKEIGCALPLMTGKTMEIIGRDLGTGLPGSCELTSSQIQEAMAQSIDEIIELIKSSLEKTPPELASDIMEKGIVLAGGGALIENLDKLITMKTGMPAHVADNPLECVVNGTGKTIEDLSQLRTVLINARKNR